MRAWLTCATLVALGCAALYGPGLSGGLVWDDFGYLRVFGSQFETVGVFEALQWFWAPRHGYGLGNYRPVLELSFVYEWRLWGGEPTGYRLTNLLLHAGSALLLAGVAWRLTGARVAAAAAGVLFAVSPAHPETCLWLACRVNLLSAFFMFAAMFAFTSRQRVLAVVCTFLAIGSKETAFALPPILTAWALCEASGAWRVRLAAALRATWPHWLVLAGYLAMRWHVLGTLVGGYVWREPPDPLSFAYAAERLELLLVTLSPVNLVRSPDSLRWVLVAVHVALLGAAATWRVRGAFVLAWFACAQVPIYNAPFGERTVEALESSRLLYEPTAALVVGLALGIGRLPAKLGVACAAAVALLYAAIARANAGPWLEVVHTSAAVAAAADRELRDGVERWIVDLPADHDGAFLFPDHDPVLQPPFHTEAVRERVHLARTRQWRDVLRRVARGGDLELLAARVRGRHDVVVEAQAPDPRWPLAVHDELSVRVARDAGFDVRVGGTLVVDLLLECRGAAQSEPLVLRLLGDGRVVAARYTRAAPEAAGVRALRVELPIPSDLEPGPHLVELEARGRLVPLVTVEVAPARGWP